MLSKFFIGSLWAAVIFYAVIYRRDLLRRIELYISALISIICFLPVIIWNLQNQLQTASFWDQENKLLKSGFNPDFFIQQLFGQFFYNNPSNFILIVSALAAILRRKTPADNMSKFLIICGLPFAAFIVLLSFFGRIMPHWPAPGYLSLIILASIYLRDNIKLRDKLFPVSIQTSLVICLLVIIFGYAQIQYGLFDLTGGATGKPEELGKKDLTLDMYGWRQAAEKFRAIDSGLVAAGKIATDAPIFSEKWYNAGHLDIYLARPLNKILFAAGPLHIIRKYHWVNMAHGGYGNVREAYYISVSRDYVSPQKYCGRLFSSIVPADTIRIFRSGKNVENMFVYLMKK
jgi:4-amino-4-deoxy-L-arabinose transferase-like glycosyltransferase